MIVMRQPCPGETVNISYESDLVPSFKGFS